MRKLHLIFLTLLLTFSGCNSQHSRSSGNLETTDSDIPKLYARVNDYAAILANEQEAELNQLLASLEDSIGSQLVILTIESLNEESIEEYSMKVAENWGLGRATHNDGVLITVAVSDRKIRIEVGYGLELIIRDEIAKNIIENTILPEFRSGNFYSGLTNGSKELINLIFAKPELAGKK
jgi:uncharacterized membrane protein YgcG